MTASFDHECIVVHQNQLLPPNLLNSSLIVSDCILQLTYRLLELGTTGEKTAAHTAEKGSSRGGSSTINDGLILLSKVGYHLG